MITSSNVSMRYVGRGDHNWVRLKAEVACNFSVLPLGGELIFSPIWARPISRACSVGSFMLGAAEGQNWDAFDALNAPVGQWEKDKTSITYIPKQNINVRLQTRSSMENKRKE